MNNNLLYLAIFLTLFSCNTAEQEKTSIISGSFGKLLTEDIIHKDFNEECQITQTGNEFTLKISNQKALYIELNKKVKIFLLPGDSIFIQELDKGYKTFGGESAKISNQLNRINQERLKILSRINYSDIFSYNSRDYKLKAHELMDQMLRSVENHSANLSNSKFVRFEKEKIKYKIYRMLNIYDVDYTDNTGIVPDLDISYYDYLGDVNFNDTSLLQLKDYMRFLESFVDLKMRQKIAKKESDNYQVTKNLINEIVRLNAVTKISDELLQILMKDEIYKLNVNDEIMSNLQTLCKNKKYISELNDSYQTYKKILSGMPVSDFRFIDQMGKVYTLSDFKGSYLYIDVWGLYCSPCLKAMPKFNEIKDIFKGKKINFIGVCRELPKNKDRWIKRMSEFNVTGLQFLPENEMQFLKDYLIGEIPRYILIDKEGRFMNANATQPSDELLNELLKIKDL